MEHNIEPHLTPNLSSTQQLGKDAISQLGTILIGNPISECHCVPFCKHKDTTTFWQMAPGGLSDILINRNHSHFQCLTTHFNANLL